jgi:hypothetical protein
MNITNKFNLPQPFVDLVSEDTYSKGESDITTTGLAQPPKISELWKRHGNEITMDCSEKVWTMLGTANHYVLEQIAKRNPERYIAECRYYADIDNVKLGGQIDLYDKKEQVLYDYKVSSVYKAMTEDHFDWTSQASVNKMLLEHNGIPVKRAAVILVMKDFKLRDSKFKADYPKCAVQEIRLNTWGEIETLAWVRNRIKLHENAKNLGDDEIPECTPEERWRIPNLYAVLKDKTAKRALPNGTYEDRLQAEAHARKVGGVVEERLGQDRRCQDYCKVGSFCSYWRRINGENSEI